MDGRQRTSSEVHTIVTRRSSVSVVYPSIDEKKKSEYTSLLDGKTEKFSWSCEIRDTWALAWPVIGTFILQILPGITNAIFLGSLGVNELAASTLATMYINVTGMGIGLGLATAMDTLCSQAYGSGNKMMLGVILQRGMLILLAASVPVACSWFWAEPLLLMLGQKPIIAKMSGDFCIHFLPGLFPLFMYEVVKKYLQCQGNVKPCLYIAIVSNLYNIAMNYFLIFTCNIGFLGAPMARASCNWVMLICAVIYIQYTGIHKETWGGWSKQALKGWGQFLKLAIPGMLMTCSEWWAFEAMTLGAGTFGEIQLNAQSVVMQIISISSMVPLGIAVASTIRVGKYLGSGNAEGARRSAIAAIGLIFMVQIVSSILTIVLKFQIPKVYTANEDARAYAAHIIPIVAGFQLFDGVQGVCAGILRGCGRQTTGAILNSVCYYLVGLPMGFIMAYHFHQEVAGLWSGMFVALFLVSSSAVLLIVKTDWENQVHKAQVRLGLKAQA
eukprot:Nk52_evm82s226 gene=Nk52_evmTU82s226